MYPASFVHLIGSVPVDTAEEGMKTLCENLPGRLYSISDGETGPRSKFVLWQVKEFWPQEVLAFKPGFTKSTDSKETPSTFELRKDNLPKSTGYAKHALPSYQLFCRLRESGVVPQGVKFQVCLPSPTSVVGLLLRPQYQAEGERLYEEVLRADLKIIQDTIPHHDLAIQWDVLAEIIFLEHAYGEPRETNEWFFTQLVPFFEPVKEGILKRIARLALPIEADVDMGLHFCYGDPQQKPIVQPINARFLAEMIDSALRNMSHRVCWVHMPVPKDRTDEAYLEPLRSLDLGKTKLVLGLVHAHDDSGTKERLEAAQKVLSNSNLGISTVCGLGRNAKEDLSSIFQICRENSSTH